jgi:hypothetical protein
MNEMYEAFATKQPYGKKKEILEEDPTSHPLFATAAYNAVVLPLRGFPLKGAIVQLGNDYPYMYYNNLLADGTNTNRPLLNKTYILTYDLRKEGFRMEKAVVSVFPSSLRKGLADPSLRIAFVNPPSSNLTVYAAHNREMRELHRQIAADDPDTSVIVPGMDAVPFSGQPRDEELLAKRSLTWIGGALYGRGGGLATGPLFDRYEGSGNRGTIHFVSPTARGLSAREGALAHFEAADVDAEYVPAEAVIDGETIKVRCPKLSRIFYVRYNWEDKPDEGLVNSVALPAPAFRSQEAGYQWFFRHSENDLPSQYFTPANEWKSGPVTLINAQLERIGYPHFSGWLGPVGVRTGPFGPNMGVREVEKGSPADGKLMVGDVIYSANGRMLGEEEEMVMAAEITKSETQELDGKLTLGVHRNGKNFDVELKLTVMGRYSETAPWDCLKTEKIVSNLQAHVAKSGPPGGFLSTEAIFMLGAGSPEYQGLVRASAGSHIGGKGDGGSNWGLGYLTIFLSEYFLSTGDKRVLPRIKDLVDKLAEHQIKEDSRRAGGWYGRGFKPRTYPAMVHTGLSAMLGLTLAKEAGVEVNEECFKKGLDYLDRKGAPVGVIIYGDAFRTRPAYMDPKAMLAGKLHSSNGKVAEAAILYRLLGDERSAYINSLISTHAWYSAYGDHGGNFWNNFWTPLGANVHGTSSMTYFMKGHRWYRECHRMWDGSLIGREASRAAGPGLALVVPGRRLRILGAPRSPFSPGAPAALKESLDAYYARDYEGAIKLAEALLADKKVEKEEVPTVEKLVEEARRMLKSISYDLARIEEYVKEGRLHESNFILSTLVPVVVEGDARLLAAKELIKKGTARDNDRELYEAALKGRAKKPATAMVEEKRTWECLTPKEFIPSKKTKKPPFGTALADGASRWRMKILESRDKAPEGWQDEGFDDSAWFETTFPVSWHLNHTAVMRTRFNVDDRNRYDLLKLRSWVFRQQDVAIYLNGVLIARVNNIEKKTGTIEEELKKGAVSVLRDGTNTLAIATRQNWRWGMLSMRVYNDGFDFMLDAGVAKD